MIFLTAFFAVRISYQIKYPVASGIFDMKWLRNGEIRRRVRVMSISMIGIDHNMAPVDIRAKFAFTKKNAGEAMEKIKNQNGIYGCVILSTCNRLEVWQVWMMR